MLRSGAAALVLSLLVSCVAPSDANVVALRDPFGLIDDVAAAGNSLRLYVLPAETYACNGDGRVSPDQESDEFLDAIVDITLMPDTATDSARGEANVPVGSWTVLVRGRGTDPVSMVPNQIIATGCASVENLENGETREVSITLQQVTGSGICGDAILSPDEQCEPPGSALCDAACQTIPQVLNNATTTGPQLAPRFAARSGHRTAAIFDSNRTDTVLRLLDPSGANITSPGALERDATLDTILGAAGSLPGVQLGGAPAVAPDGRLAIPVIDFVVPTDTDVRMVFLNEDRTVVTGGAGVHLKMARPMSQAAPRAAYAGTGSLLVAFEDPASATGLSATFFAAGSIAPSGEAVAVGSTGGAQPALAGLESGFVLAFAAGGDVFFQRFAADGTATDATPVAVLDTAPGTQDQPAIAVLGTGVFAVAWREGDVASGDGAGTAIRARIFGADGAARGAAFVVNTTTAGDQVTPTLAAADGRFLFAWQSGAEIRARVFGENGVGLLNRERMPTATDFLVGGGTATAPTACAVDGASWLIGWTLPSDGAGDLLFRRYPR